MERHATWSEHVSHSLCPLWVHVGFLQELGSLSESPMTRIILLYFVVCEQVVFGNAEKGFCTLPGHDIGPI